MARNSFHASKTRAIRDSLTSLVSCIPFWPAFFVEICAYNSAVMLASLSDSRMAAFYPAKASGVLILADVGCRFYCQYLTKAKWYADTAAILVGILRLETNISQDRTQKISVSETRLRALSSFISFTMPCQNAKLAAFRWSVIPQTRNLWAGLSARYWFEAGPHPFSFMVTAHIELWRSLLW